MHKILRRHAHHDHIPVRGVGGVCAMTSACKMLLPAPVAALMMPRLRLALR